MKKNRQEAIIELIQQYPIETQEELLSRLNQIGFKTTQATISRDIRELALIKKPDADGKQIYCLIDQEDETSRKYQRILAEAIISMELAENMLVVKTVSGMAMASAAALDSLNIIGTQLWRALHQAGHGEDPGLCDAAVFHLPEPRAGRRRLGPVEFEIGQLLLQRQRRGL